MFEARGTEFRASGGEAMLTGFKMARTGVRGVTNRLAAGDLESCLPGQRVAAPDVAALKLQSRILELYDNLRIPVFRYLICLGVQHEEADEILQETFLRAYKHLHGGGEAHNLRGWVFRVAHNIAVNQFKKQRRFGGAEPESYESFPVAADPSPNAEELLLRKEKLRGICNSIKTLSAQELHCVHLRAEGLRYREIGDILGIGVSTVADSLRRAIAKLAGGEDA